MEPKTTRRWHLYGAGLENLGKHGRVETVDLPAEIGPREILVRYDAVGICFSDVKIVRQGNNHPRLAGRDLQRDPVVLGHEIALTIVAVGDAYADNFVIGARFVLQPDVFYGGVGVTVGYALPGGMSEYGILDEQIVEGDEGCYLLPVPDGVGHASAALVEPWACVVGAYRWRGKNGVVVRPDSGNIGAQSVAVDVGKIHYDSEWFVVGTGDDMRDDLRAGGAAWFVGAGGPMGQMHVQRALNLPAPPRRVVCTDLSDERLATLRARFAEKARARGIEFVAVGNLENSYVDFDDIVVLAPSVGAIEMAFPHLTNGGVMNLFAGIPRGTMAHLPLADMHSKNVRIVGTTGSSLADMRDALAAEARGELDTRQSVVAIGGLDAFRDGLAAASEGRFAGKVVIFPHVDLPDVVALPDLAVSLPTIFAKLEDGRVWTLAAEAELFRLRGKNR